MTAQRPSLEMSIAYGLTPVEMRSFVSVTVEPSTLSTPAPFSSRSATMADLPSCVNETPDMRLSPTFTWPMSLTFLPSIVSTFTVPSCAAASSSVPSRLIDRPFGWPPTSTLPISVGGDASRSTICRKLSKSSFFAA